MSDVTPFTGGEGQVPAAESLIGSDVSVFTPPLADFDWDAYEARQARLDQVLLAGDPETLAATIRELHAEDPDTGVKMNNLHNTVLRGNLSGLLAPLGVMSQTSVEADIPGFDFKGGVAPRAGFDGKNFRGADFVDSILTEATFRGSNLKGVDFTNATLTGADFTDASIDGADFSGAYMVGVKGLDDPEVLKRINLKAARTIVADGMADGSLERFLASHFGDARDLETIKRMLDPVPIAIDQTVPRLQTKRNLRGLVARHLQANDVDFSASQLVGAHIEDMAATGAQFRNVMFSGAIILKSVLRNADFVSAWAPGIILEDVDMRGSRLTNANFVGAILRGVDLRDVVGLEAKDTNLEGIVIGEDCKLPNGYGYNGVVLERSRKLNRELES